MLIGKKIAVHARSLTAGAPRKPDRPGARFTFDDRHSADTDDDRQDRPGPMPSDYKSYEHFRIKRARNAIIRFQRPGGCYESPDLRGLK